MNYLEKIGVQTFLKKSINFIEKHFKDLNKWRDIFYSWIRDSEEWRDYFSSNWSTDSIQSQWKIPRDIVCVCVTEKLILKYL